LIYHVPVERLLFVMLLIHSTIPIKVTATDSHSTVESTQLCILCINYGLNFHAVQCCTAVRVSCNIGLTESFQVIFMKVWRIMQ